MRILPGYRADRAPRALHHAAIGPESGGLGAGYVPHADGPVATTSPKKGVLWGPGMGPGRRGA